MTEVNIYCEVVGGPANAAANPDRRCTGPMMVAFSLFDALLKHTSIDFYFYTLAPSVVVHPRIRPFAGVSPAKIHHVLFGLDLAEAVLSQASGAPVILGPNVVFNLPRGDVRYQELDAESKRIVDRETALARARAALYLFPSLYDQELATRRLSTARIAEFPCGIDTEKFKPAQSERPIDVAIMPKGKYSDRETYSLSLDLAEKVAARLEGQFTFEFLVDYEHADYPKLLERYKLVMNTTPWETQGIAIMEAQAAGVPVIHRRGLPFQPTSLKLCQREYTADDFVQAVGPALANRAELSERSRRHIEQNFSLPRMASQYQHLLSLLLAETTHADRKL